MDLAKELNFAIEIIEQILMYCNTEDILTLGTLKSRKKCNNSYQKGRKSYKIIYFLCPR
jgi:hypothetical protein